MSGIPSMTFHRAMTIERGPQAYLNAISKFITLKGNNKFRREKHWLCFLNNVKY
jgi:hypothetical protein